MSLFDLASARVHGDRLAHIVGLDIIFLGSLDTCTESIKKIRFKIKSFSDRIGSHMSNVGDRAQRMGGRAGGHLVLRDRGVVGGDALVVLERDLLVERAQDLLGLHPLVRSKRGLQRALHLPNANSFQERERSLFVNV